MAILSDLTPEILAIILDTITYRYPNGDTMALLLTGDSSFNQKLKQALSQIVVTSSFKQVDTKPSVFDTYVKRISGSWKTDSAELLALYANLPINNVTELSVKVQPTVEQFTKFVNLKTLNVLFADNAIDLNLIRNLSQLSELSAKVSAIPQDLILDGISKMTITTDAQINFAEVFPNLEELEFIFDKEYFYDDDEKFAYIVDVSGLVLLRKLAIGSNFESSYQNVRLNVGDLALEAIDISSYIGVDFHKINFTKIVELDILDHETLSNFDGGPLRKGWFDFIANQCASNVKSLRISPINDEINKKLHLFTELRKLEFYEGTVDAVNLKSHHLHKLGFKNSDSMLNIDYLHCIPSLKIMSMNIKHNTSFLQKLNLTFVDISTRSQYILGVVPHIMHIGRVRLAVCEPIDRELFVGVTQAFIKNHKGIMQKQKLFNICRNFSFWCIGCPEKISASYEKLFKTFIKNGYMDSYGDE
jgi:hypothetical protein